MDFPAGRRYTQGKGALERPVHIRSEGFLGGVTNSKAGLGREQTRTPHETFVSPDGAGQRWPSSLSKLAAIEHRTNAAYYAGSSRKRTARTLEGRSIATGSLNAGFRARLNSNGVCQVKTYGKGDRRRSRGRHDVGCASEQTAKPCRSSA